MKPKVKYIIGVILIALVLNFLKNGIAQTAIGMTLSSVARVPVHIGSTSLSLFASRIDLRNIRVSNPRGFPGNPMLHLPQIYIDFELGSAFKETLHFESVAVQLKELTIIKNKKGEVNIDAVKPKETQEKAKPAKARKLKIDKLSISIGRVTYKDYSKGGDPEIQVFDVNIQNRTYANIDSPNGVLSLILFEALTRTTISRLANIDISNFKDSAREALGGSLDMLTEGAGSLEESAKGLLNIFK